MNSHHIPSLSYVTIDAILAIESDVYMVAVGVADLYSHIFFISNRIIVIADPYQLSIEGWCDVTGEIQFDTTILIPTKLPTASKEENEKKIRVETFDIIFQTFGNTR